MTVVAIWREGQVLWAVADTRISAAGAQGVIIRTDSAAKLLPLRVRCRQIPLMSGVLAPAHFDRTFGFAYAGDTLPALQAYAAAVAFLDSLQANGHTHPPSLGQIAGLVRGLGTRFGREVAASRRSTALDLTLAVFGYCPAQQKHAIYLMTPATGEQTLSLEEVFPESELSPVIFGSGANSIQAELADLRSSGDSFGRTARLPKIAIERVVRRQEPGEVGGSMSIGMADAQEFRLYQEVRPIVPGQPMVMMTFNGIEINDEIGSVGRYFVGMPGIS